ncbi:MAG: PEP-CTERM sorting domain-containing protein [Armatimonadetes bacterium]|nr:PEP-CTERM sorting domain-containing protein [Armatimonadota bacterium]
MRREITAALVILVSSVCSAQRLLPNSYIEKATPTVKALVAHVKNNPTVMDRYVRHFQMTPDEVIRFISSLKVGRLKQDTYFKVWNVPVATGELRQRTLLFKKGERFFFDSNGTPLIAVVCGNPIIRTDEADIPRLAPAVSGPLEGIVVELPGVAPVQTEINLLQPETPAPAPDVIAPPRPPNAVPLLGLLPALFFGINNGGGGGTIPEPSTIVMMGAGCAFLIGRARRRSR